MSSSRSLAPALLPAAAAAAILFGTGDARAEAPAPGDPPAKRPVTIEVATKGGAIGSGVSLGARAGVDWRNLYGGVSAVYLTPADTHERGRGILYGAEVGYGFKSGEDNWFTLRPQV